MGTSTLVATGVVATLAVAVLAAVISWEVSDHRLRRERRLDGPRRPAWMSLRVLIIVPAVVFGYLVGQEQWVLAAVAFLTGAIFRIGIDRRERRRSDGEQHQGVE